MSTNSPLSASRLKQALDCSWLYYQTSKLKVPETTHPKTKLGTLVHSILECLSRKKHFNHYIAVVHHQSVYGSPALTRMVQMFSRKNLDVTEEILSHLDKLVMVALNHDFNFQGAKEILPPEQAFEIDFGDFSIRGFMDRVALYDNVAVIRDYKTQSKRFTEEQLDFNLQALFYQTAVKHLYGLPAKVEFIMLRFPANKKDGARYIQSVAPSTDDQLEGFRYYLASCSETISNMTLEDATKNMKASRDKGFCQYVCSLRQPFDYWVLVEGDKTIRGARTIEELTPKDGQTIEKRRYKGCHAFYGRSSNYHRRLG